MPSSSMGSIRGNHSTRTSLTSSAQTSLWASSLLPLTAYRSGGTSLDPLTANRQELRLPIVLGLSMGQKELGMHVMEVMLVF